jgi:DNA-binding NtrC family response regulator
MAQAQTILIVHEDPKILARLAARLKVAGGDVSTATTFAKAKALLTAAPPKVLITGVRLGEYNGLHLIIRTRVDHPMTSAILISDRVDPVNEMEAANYDAAYVPYPAEANRLLSLVVEALSKSAV